MHLRLVTQPFDWSTNLRDFLRSALAVPGYTHVDVVVAWAKRSGLNQVRDDLEAFRARGGATRIILGISQGGATRQGLEIALELFDEVFVFHHVGRTFHPKLYLAWGGNGARAFIGSQNLTLGGTITNYEVASEFVAPILGADDQEFVDSIHAYVDALLDREANCLRLDHALLATLVQDPRYRIGDEDALPQSGAADPTRGGVFGGGPLGLRVAPPAAGRGPGSGAHVVHRWFKANLRASDAQRLGGDSNPSGHITLVKAGHDIEPASYFRDEFFVSAPWHPVTGTAGREQAAVAVEVRNRDTVMGVFDLVVDSNPSFGSGQSNREAMLRWGPDLNAHMQHEVNHVGDTVTIEAMSDGTYRLTFDDVETGHLI